MIVMFGRKHIHFDVSYLFSIVEWPGSCGIWGIRLGEGGLVSLIECMQDAQGGILQISIRLRKKILHYRFC